MTWAGGLGRWFAARCDSVDADYVAPGRGRERSPAGGLLAFTVRADEPGPGLCVFSGAADVAGVVVVLPYRCACGLRVVGGTPCWWPWTPTRAWEGSAGNGWWSGCRPADRW